ncbi:glycoside hydrolase family 10 protein [Allorhizocola rhizosphaerae]|uniref:glycoside hydrolase family 10 protein n=1 Tax=Allorhizocola rhizosphaerae TaxID=1872709 RepID=UPI001FEBDE89|nr:family 10 glycosylhydrolase [Allorhizocola rhizosphaerae]
MVAVLAGALLAGSFLALRVVAKPSTPVNTAETPRLLAAAPPFTCAGRTATGARQLRGMWLTTISNRDWPSKPGLDEKTVKAEFRSWLDLAQRMNHNAIFVHVRPSGDAFWPSRFAPWSYWLTGRADGRSPGWDPMAFMVAETHARSMEFHAWFNPYKAGQTGKLDGLAPDHPLRRHPEWAVTYPGPAESSSARIYYNPGIPEARRFVEDSILEVAEKYDIDGIHFDDFFYPYPSGEQDFPDDDAFARYGAGASRDDWRRANVNVFVQETYTRIKQIKPWVKFGISPFGIWRNKSTDARGSATSGLQSYDAIYADTRLWVTNGWLDYIVPQLYWHIGFEVADYSVLLPWWSKLVSGTNVQLYIGQADYRIGQKGVWGDPAELERQLALNRDHQVSGSIHFSARQVRDDPLGAVSRYRDAHYGTPALVPAMPHLPGVRPQPPAIAGAKRADATVTLTWRADSKPANTRHAIYRVDMSGQDPAQLLATVAGGTRTWVDKTAEPGRPYAYCVTTLDRLWNESPASPEQVVQS